jgi:3-phosphoglycerate kinase
MVGTEVASADELASLADVFVNDGFGGAGS